MELAPLDRLSVINSLPREGKFEDLIIFKDITKKVEFTQKEIIDWEIRTDDTGAILWNDKAKSIKVEFTDAEKVLIKSTFKNLSDEGKMKTFMIDLYQALIK